MAVVYCTECEGKVSRKLDACPHCGNPLVEKGKPHKAGIRYKASMLVGTLITIYFGIRIVNEIDPRITIVFFALGGIAILILKFGSWWNHG